MKPDQKDHGSRKEREGCARRTPERYSAYDPFAGAYERYWCEEVPPQIFTVIERWLLPRLQPGARILDLCCGTGHTTAQLEHLGYHVTGLDGSEEMLRRARQNAPHSHFTLADARSFRFQRVFDAVVSTFDSLNHMMKLEEVEAVIMNVHAALAPSGLFFFDMNMEQGFLDHWAEYFSIVEQDEACILRGEYDAETGTGRYDITMFQFEGDAWRRRDAVITEKCYSMKEVRGALYRAGFRQITVRDAVRDFGLTDHTGRKFFLARKES